MTPRPGPAPADLAVRGRRVAGRTFRLPPLQARCCSRRCGPRPGTWTSSSWRRRGGPRKRPPARAATSSSLADALLVVAEAFLAGRWPPMTRRCTRSSCTSAPTPARRRRPRDAADLAGARNPRPGAVPRRGRPRGQREHRADAQLHRRLELDAARPRRHRARPGPPRRRRASAALRRAARERDTCRCRFPGCESRRVDLHHIQYWSHGGRTSLDNLISLCKYHHMLVHDRGYLIAATTRRRVRLLPPGRHRHPAQPRPAPPRRHHRRLPRRRHHPGHDHPALVRRAAQPGRRHLHLPGQRPDPARTPRAAGPGRRPRTGFRPRKWVVEPADWIRYIQEHAAA